MRQSAKEFFSGLHQTYLKPSGYRKVRQTFSRKLDGYTERVQFQGSAFNDSSRPCRFYINFGVEFHDLRPQVPCRDFPETHCWTRIEAIVQRAPGQYDLPQENVMAFAEGISHLLSQASAVVAAQIHDIRKSYMEAKTSHLTVAEQE